MGSGSCTGIGMSGMLSIYLTLIRLLNGLRKTELFRVLTSLFYMANMLTGMIREMSVCNVIIGNNMLDYNNPIIHRPYLENYKCSTNKDLWDVVEGARRSYNKIIENGDFIVRPSCLFPRVGDILTNDIIHRWKTAKILRNSLKPSNNLSKWPVLKR